MLMADIVKGIHREHRWEVAHLDHPHSQWMKDPLDLLDKGIGVLQVIEHGDGGDDLRARAIILLRGEVVRDQDLTVVAQLPMEIPSWIEGVAIEVISQLRVGTQ